MVETESLVALRERQLSVLKKLSLLKDQAPQDQAPDQVGSGPFPASFSATIILVLTDTFELNLLGHPQVVRNHKRTSDTQALLAKELLSKGVVPHTFVRVPHDYYECATNTCLR